MQQRRRGGVALCGGHGLRRLALLHHPDRLDGRNELHLYRDGYKRGRLWKPRDLQSLLHGVSVDKLGVRIFVPLLVPGTVALPSFPRFFVSCVSHSQARATLSYSTPSLTLGTGATTGYFGYSVSMSQDGLTAIVGAPAASSGAGQAYVFTNSGSVWGSPLLLGSGAAQNDRFGNPVALAGATAVVGGPGGL